MFTMPTVRPHLSVHSDHLPEPGKVKVEMTLRDGYAVLSANLSSGLEVLLFTPALTPEQAGEYLLALSDAATAARLSLSL